MVSVTMICLSMLVALVVETHAATFAERVPQKPMEFAHKKGCYIKEINDVIGYGDEVTLLGSCYRIECSRHRIYYDTCGTVGTDDPQCHVTDVDVSRPYPACCPEVQCELDNNI